MRRPDVLRWTLALSAWLAAFASLDAAVPVGRRMSYLDNGHVRVGVDLNHGGAIVFLARAGDSNLINSHDLGRQVQLSFYSGPVPFTADGQKPPKHWEHLGWNPVQTGDDFRNPSRVLAHTNDGRALHVRCQPMQWPLNNVPGDCTFDSWLELDGPVVKGRARLTNARQDRTPYPARQQELPAVYANGAFPRVLSYQGDRPFTGDAATPVPKPGGRHPWSFWLGTEGWTALLGPDDRGLGVISPGRIQFTGGFHGRPGPNDPAADATAYVASLATEILDPDIVYEFRYELLPGSLAEIRARAAAVRAQGLPAWQFTRDRQGWHYANALDQGWPIQDGLEVRVDRHDPQLLSPPVFWRAEDAPWVIVEAAFQTRHPKATLFWQRHGQGGPGAEDQLEFPVQNDGKLRPYAVRLADAAGYRGGMIRLRLDPAPAGQPGDTVRVRSIRLAASAP
ncbi:MAG: hypothetical protein RJA22_1694 [Verrucomicrobiota bacterium]